MNPLLRSFASPKHPRKVQHFLDDQRLYIVKQNQQTPLSDSVHSRSLNSSEQFEQHEVSP